MALTAKGFTGSVGQVDFSRIDRGGLGDGIVGSLPSAASLRADRVVGQDRRVSIQIGDAKVPGVRATSDALASYDFPANASGQPRLDWLVLRFSWSTDPGTVVFGHVLGTPASIPQRPVLTQTPGVLWELPLALVRVDAGVGSFPADAVADARYWLGDGVTVQQQRAIDPPVRPGRLLYIVSTGELLSSNGTATWSPVAPVVTTGSISLATGWSAYGSSFETPGYRLSHGVVYGAGLVRRTGAAYTMTSTGLVQVATLPAAIRPSKERALVCMASGGPLRLHVRTDGSLLLTVEGDSRVMPLNSGWFSLDGVTWRL